MKTEKVENSAVLLKGSISRLERTRRSHDFVLTKIQQQQIGLTALATAAAGIGSAGMGLINMAGNSDEEADWVEFELEGKQLEGWLWLMPMRNGDKVEVVAKQIRQNHYLAYAVKRDSDDLLAVYPHATSGRKIHYRSSIKIWLWCTLILNLVTATLFVLPKGLSTLLDFDMQIFLLSGTIFLSLISAIIAFRVSQKLMGFVRIAEMIFKTFGWSDIESIDLRKTSIENRIENKLPNFGIFYFRYK